MSEETGPCCGKGGWCRMSSMWGTLGGLGWGTGLGWGFAIVLALGYADARLCRFASARRAACCVPVVLLTARSEAPRWANRSCWPPAGRWDTARTRSRCRPACGSVWDRLSEPGPLIVSWPEPVGKQVHHRAVFPRDYSRCRSPLRRFPASTAAARPFRCPWWICMSAAPLGPAAQGDVAGLRPLVMSFASPSAESARRISSCSSLRSRPPSRPGCSGPIFTRWLKCLRAIRPVPSSSTRREITSRPPCR